MKTLLRNPITGLYFDGVNFSADRAGAKVLDGAPHPAVINHVWPGAEVVPVCDPEPSMNSGAGALRAS